MPHKILGYNLDYKETMKRNLQLHFNRQVFFNERTVQKLPEIWQKIAKHCYTLMVKIWHLFYIVFSYHNTKIPYEFFGQTNILKCISIFKTKILERTFEPSIIEFNDWHETLPRPRSMFWINFAWQEIRYIYDYQQTKLIHAHCSYYAWTERMQRLTTNCLGQYYHLY